MDFWNSEFRAENNVEENWEENYESGKNGPDKIITTFGQKYSDGFDDIFSYFLVSSVVFFIQKLLRETIL